MFTISHHTSNCLKFSAETTKEAWCCALGQELGNTERCSNLANGVMMADVTDGRPPALLVSLGRNVPDVQITVVSTSRDEGLIPTTGYPLAKCPNKGFPLPTNKYSAAL